MPCQARCQLARLLDHRAAAQAKNEQLAVKAAAISEEELEAVRAEAAQRVAAAERKVPAAAPPGMQLLRFPVHLTLEATWVTRVIFAAGVFPIADPLNCREMLSSRLDLPLQVYALSKERDALRRGSDKLSSAAGLLKEKDDIIQQARTRLPAQ